jgi:polysaccharide biosynthesis transport protein
MKVIAVTSALPGEGKTTTASNLAVVLAQAGHEVALVDADLRRPRAHEVFAVPPVPGLTEALLGEPIDLVVSDLGGHLHVVTAGRVPPNPSEMMSNARFDAFLKAMAARYEYVVLDAPPILPVSDSVALTRWVDGVLVVAQADRLSRRDLTESLARLERVGAPVIGLVLNKARSSGTEGGTYGYSYGYGYGARPQPEDDEQPASAQPGSVL